MDNEIRKGIENQMRSSSVNLNGEVYVPLNEAIIHAKSFIAMSKRSGQQELEQRIHELLPNDCVENWAEVKFCPLRQGDGGACKQCD